MSSSPWGKTEETFPAAQWPVAASRLCAGDRRRLSCRPRPLGSAAVRAHAAPGVLPQCGPMRPGHLHSLCFPGCNSRGGVLEATHYVALSCLLLSAAALCRFPFILKGGAAPPQSHLCRSL